MKKLHKINRVLFLIAMLLFVNLMFSQITVKGITIGEETPIKEYKVTTVAGVPVVVVPYKLESGTVHSIGIIPSDGVNVNRVHYTDLENIIHGLEANFDIKLKKRFENSYSKDCTYSYKDKNHHFFITVEHNQYMDAPYDVAILIIDLQLQEIADKEEKTKTKRDF